MIEAKWEYIRAQESNFYGKPTEACFERVLGSTIVSVKEDGRVERRTLEGDRTYSNPLEVPGFTLKEIEQAKLLQRLLQHIN